MLAVLSSLLQVSSYLDFPLLLNHRTCGTRSSQDSTLSHASLHFSNFTSLALIIWKYYLSLSTFLDSLSVRLHVTWLFSASSVNLYVYNVLIILLKSKSFIFVFWLMKFLWLGPWPHGFIYHHHHIALVARISLTLSRHSSLSFIALGRSSGQHPVSSHSC